MLAFDGLTPALPASFQYLMAFNSLRGIEVDELNTSSLDVAIYEVYFALITGTTVDRSQIALLYEKKTRTELF
jgi:hypothetical protein